MADENIIKFDPQTAEYVLWVEARHIKERPVVSHFYRYGLDYLKTVDQIELPEEDGGIVEIRDADIARVLIHWNGETGYFAMDERRVLNKLGSRCSIVTDNYGFNLVLSFQHLPVKYSELFNMIIDIGMDRGGSETLAERKEDIIRFIDIYIERGYTGLYVAKALLMASSDWYSCTITSNQLFRNILHEGVGKGCLSPDNHIGWNWMTIAAKHNDPSEFMDDMDLYYDILATASEHGVIEARDIMDMIWEPENCIEED